VRVVFDIDLAIHRLGVLGGGAATIRTLPLTALRLP